MTSTMQTLRRAQTRRPMFQLWGWAMLFVVLLCSAAASGQPRTRIVGSAFDPTTTSVALNPKQPRAMAKMVKSAKGRLPGRDAVAAPLLAPAAGWSVWIAGARYPGRTFYAAFADDAANRVPLLPLGARAPPRT